jgi:hypothetical protein
VQCAGLLAGNAPREVNSQFSHAMSCPAQQGKALP